MNRKDKIRLLKAIHSGTGRPQDLKPKQLDVYIGKGSIYKIDGQVVSFEEYYKEEARQEVLFGPLTMEVWIGNKQLPHD